MTSDDTPGTLPQCVACPGGSRCFRERSGTLANAYALGCRSPEATSANASKARERRARVRSGGSSGSLPDAWADPEDYPAREPTGDVCACGSPFYWEIGRGAQTCSNGHWEHAPETETRVIRETTREVEIAGKPSLMPERAARARLRALRETSEQWLAGWISTLGDPGNFDDSQWQQQSRQFGALLRGFVPEVRDAESESELAEIKRYIAAQIILSDAGRKLRAEYDQARERISDDEYYDEYDDDESGDDETDNDEPSNDETDNAITGKVLPAESHNPYSWRNPWESWDNAAQTIARNTGTPQLATPQSIAKQQYRAQSDVNPMALTIGIASEAIRRKQTSLETNGACQFAHRFGRKAIATRLYGIPHRMPNGQATQYASPNTRHYLACDNHYADAVSTLIRGGYKDICYWTLPLQRPVINDQSNGLSW